MNTMHSTEPNIISACSIWQFLPIGLFVADSGGMIVEANDHMFSYFNLPREPLAGKQFGDVFQCHSSIIENARCGSASTCGDCPIRNSITSVLAGDGDLREIELRHEFVINGRKAAKWFSVNVSQIHEQGERYAIVALTDISSRKKHEKELTELGIMDGLTGLYNRRFIMQQLESLLYYSDQSKFPLTIAMLDIDDFKSINSNFGHPVGDAALIGFADIFKKNTRDTDYAGRFGGDEFLLIFENTGALYTQNILSRISKRFKNVLQEDFSPTFSAGIIEIDVKNAGKMNIDALIQRMDELLYQVKRDGKNQVAV